MAIFSLARLVYSYIWNHSPKVYPNSRIMLAETAAWSICCGEGWLIDELIDERRLLMGIINEDFQCRMIGITSNGGGDNNIITLLCNEASI
mmetsp:Transcript_19813/g.33513  ORF Transcript_19813/g.33513 Transcript_19813/m.33513 type:complete len:91 (+) Transcript_19813:744-1016(+)